MDSWQKIYFFFESLAQMLINSVQWLVFPSWKWAKSGWIPKLHVRSCLSTALEVNRKQTKIMLLFWQKLQLGSSKNPRIYIKGHKWTQSLKSETVTLLNSPSTCKKVQKGILIKWVFKKNTNLKQKKPQSKHWDNKGKRYLELRKSFRHYFTVHKLRIWIIYYILLTIADSLFWQVIW